MVVFVVDFDAFMFMLCFFSGVSFSPFAVRDLTFDIVHNVTNAQTCGGDPKDGIACTEIPRTLVVSTYLPILVGSL